ncbi:MAG: DoxX family protein [Gammaproteobacteria bacterium]|nr:DoxX family protein [Gammaproteobacteria bacterium]
MIALINKAQDLLDGTRAVDWLGPLALRLYLVPVFWVAGMNKVNGFENIVEWFGNPDWGLGLPFPFLMAALATAAEVGGAIALALGLATRWASIPLMVTMLVAAVTTHWHNGWQAVADPKSPFAGADVGEAMDRLDRARSILQEHGNYEWLTEHGSIVVSNNGIEWAATYFVMLLALFFIGGGKYVSADYWIAKRFRR